VKAYSGIYFKLKILFLVRAGINALVFEMTLRRKLGPRDSDPTPPFRARLAGITGLILWARVI